MTVCCYQIMNVKVLIQTITEMPEVELLAELVENFTKQGKVLVPDLKKLFVMTAAVFGSSDRQTIQCGRTLVEILCKQLLATDIEHAWTVCSPAMIQALGFEDSQIRKYVRSATMLMLSKTTNPHIFLDALNKIGLEHSSHLVVAKSMKMICRVLEYDVNLLAKKANVPVVKLSLEQFISFSKDPLPMLQEYSRASLIRIYAIGVKNLEEVILRMDSHFREELERLWNDQKNALAEKQRQREGPE